MHIFDISVWWQWAALRKLWVPLLHYSEDMLWVNPYKGKCKGKDWYAFKRLSKIINREGNWKPPPNQWKVLCYVTYP